MHMNTPPARAYRAPVPGRREAPELAELAREGPSEAGMDALRRICRASGGVARGDDLARLLEDCRCGDLVDLARLIGHRDIFAIDWHGSLWVPMFQFDLRDLSVRPGMRRVLAEVDAVFDGWTLAVWFAQPNGWLQGRRPLELLDSEPDPVIRAARVDRFVAELAATHELTDWRHP